MCAAQSSLTAMPEIHTVVYKRVGELNILMDVYATKSGSSCSSADATRPRPVILYFHGGCLLYGDRRSWMPTWLIEELVMQRGWTFLSADYRLLPESSTDDILDDVLSAYAFIQEGRLNQQLSQRQLHPVDSRRVVIAGSSAGGYLALQAGVLCRQAPPRAILDFYGETWATSRWYGRPQPQATILGVEVAKVDDQAVAGLLNTRASPISAFPLGDWSAPRLLLYHYAIKHGLYWKLTMGVDDIEEVPENKKHLLPLLNIRPPFPDAPLNSPLPFRIGAYPPTVVVHGTSDSVVPCSDSDELIKVLYRARVDYVYHRVEMREHGLLSDSDPEMANIRASIINFLLTRV